MSVWLWSFLKLHCDSIHSTQKSARMWVNECTFLFSRCKTDGIQIYKDIKLKMTSVPSASNRYELVISDRLSYTCTNTKLTETKLHVQPWWISLTVLSPRSVDVENEKVKVVMVFFPALGSDKTRAHSKELVKAPFMWGQGERMRLSFSQFLNCTLFFWTLGRLQAKFTLALI